MLFGFHITTTKLTTKIYVHGVYALMNWAERRTHFLVTVEPNSNHIPQACYVGKPFCGVKCSDDNNPQMLWEMEAKAVVGKDHLVIRHL